MAMLNIATWNVRGLGGENMRPKLRIIKRYMRDNRIQILLLQETKLDERGIQDKKTWWKGAQYWAPARGSQGGTAILLTKDCPGQVIDEAVDGYGHWQWIKLKLEFRTIGICNVYVPSQRHNKQIFMEHLPWRLPDTAQYIIAGDWNAIVEPGLDSPRGGPPSTSTTNMRKFVAEEELSDVYRIRYPTTHG
jgi:exonuclease III